MNKTLPLILLLVFVSGFIHTGTIHAVTLSSRELLMDVDDGTGRLNLSSVVGTDDTAGAERENLLFYDKPPSSYTVIYLDNDVFAFGGDRGRFTKRPSVEEKSIVSVWENDRIKVIQRIQFVERQNTGAQDGVLISYLLENKGRANALIGLRILFDTFLGERDIHHFELSGDQQVRYETALEKGSLPSYWVSKAKDKPKTCLRGVLKGELVTSPDRIIFANYRALGEELFEYKVKSKKKFDLLPYSRNDSAVAIFYSPISIQPGASREYSTILGLCSSGEYALLEKPSMPEKEEEVFPGPVEGEEEEEAPRIDLASIVRDLESIKWERGYLASINELIAKLNSAIKDEGKTLSEEEIIRLKSALDSLRKGK